MPDVTKIESKGGDKPERTGPRVVPGDYQVRLTYGDTVLTQPFKILRDPRLSTTPREYQALFDLLTKICAKHDEINQTVNGIRRIREDVVLWARRADSAGKQSVVDSAKELTRKIDEIEDTLLQRKIESEQDSLNFPVKLNHKLAMLAFYLDMGEAAPTNQSVELYEHLSKLVDAQLAAWKRLLRAEVKAFNNVVRTAKMPPIPV
jgi:hypothetical protein